MNLKKGDKLLCKKSACVVGILTNKIIFEKNNFYEIHEIVKHFKDFAGDIYEELYYIKGEKDNYHTFNDTTELFEYFYTQTEERKEKLKKIENEI